MCQLTWNTLEFTALFLCDNRTNYLYENINIWKYGNMKWMNGWMNERTGYLTCLLCSPMRYPGQYSK